MIRTGVTVLGCAVAAACVTMWQEANYRQASQDATDTMLLWSGDVVRQQRVNDCGLAALVMLARIRGITMDFATLSRDIGVLPDGSSLELLQKIAAAHSMTLMGIFAETKDTTGIATPWIAHFRTRYGHFVVVEGLTTTHVTVVDPGAGRVRYTQRAFRKRWSGYGLAPMSAALRVQTNGGKSAD